MATKKKLESSLEGLFSKSRAKPVVQGKPAEDSVPAHPAAAHVKTNAQEEKKTPAPAAPKSVPSKTAPKPSAPVKAQAQPKAKTQARTETPPVSALKPDLPEPPLQPQPIPAEKQSPPTTTPKMDEAVDDIPTTAAGALVKSEPAAQALATLDSDVEEEKQILIFRLEDVDYGAEVEQVQTIIKPQTVFLVPGTDVFIKGLINLRGEVVPVVDLRTRFNLPPRNTDKNTRFVVIEVKDYKASLIVDAVEGVATISASLIEKPSELVMEIETRYLKGIARMDGQLILILNLEQTIRSDMEE